MIVTVTLNPSLQVEYRTERLKPGRANPVSSVTVRAAGAGLAAARLLATFGHDVVAAGLAGGSAGELIRADLARAGVANQFTPIAAESRRVVTVLDESSGQATRLAEPVPYITTEELGRLASDYRALLDGADAVLLSGGLPAGLPAETYASLTSYAVSAGVPVIVAAAGDALRHAAERGPALVIPDLAAGEREPARAGAAALVLAAGRAVRVRTGQGAWLAELPAGWPAARPAAARLAGDPAADGAAAFRDALAAGFVPGIALSWSWPDMLRHALALAGSVTADGEVDLAGYEALLPAVAVTGR